MNIANENQKRKEKAAQNERAANKEVTQIKSGGMKIKPRITQMKY